MAVLNFDLCQCFLDFGETMSEMAMLLSFILFGVVISDLFLDAPLLPALALAAIVVFVARPLAIGIVLRGAAVSNAARASIGWFGPRGLNSLLLALLVIQNDVAGGEFLLAVVGVVVTVSVVFHGRLAGHHDGLRAGHPGGPAAGGGGEGVGLTTLRHCYDAREERSI